MYKEKWSLKPKLIMKKKFYPMLLIAALSLSACTDVTEPTVDYGGNTFINDYSTLVDAVNNLNKTLKERFDALNTLLRDGMADIKVAVEANTGAITVLSENTKNGLKDINTSLFNGFEALSLQMTTLTGQITAQGEAIVYAMNQNGDILRLQIDTTGKLISAQILASGNALVDVINNQGNTMAERIAALTAAVKGGLADIKVEINNNTGAITAQGESLKAGLNTINTTIFNGFTAIKTTMNENAEVLRLQIDTTGNLLNATLIANAEAIIKTINDQTSTMKERFNALTTAIETGLKDIKVEINKNTGAIKLLDDNTQGSLGNINTSLLKIDETLLNGFTAIKTTIDDNGDKIVTAMDRNGEVLRFNFVSKVMPSNKARYYKALRDQAEMKEAYEKQLAEKQRAYDGLSESLKACRKDNAELQSLLDDCEKSKKVKSYEVFFTVDKTNITTQERLRLKKFINTLKEQGDYKLTIIGEASSDGVSSKNYKLSEGRLNNVVNFLKKQGIKDFDIKLGKAIGDSNGCSKEECRRVLIIIE